jgi:hypothetical protein
MADALVDGLSTCVLARVIFPPMISLEFVRAFHFTLPHAIIALTFPLVCVQVGAGSHTLMGMDAMCVRIASCTG